jgi:hypothetical protein
MFIFTAPAETDKKSGVESFFIHEARWLCIEQFCCARSTAKDDDNVSH